MKYMLLLFSEIRSEDYSPEAMAPWNAFREEAERRSTILGSQALQPGNTATVVSVRDGNTVMTDGPFVDTKEQLGGFYLLDCDNLDVALQLAAKVPWAFTGHIEVRPVLEFE